MSISDKISEVLAANPGYSWNDLVMRQLQTTLSNTRGNISDLWMLWFAQQGYTLGGLSERMAAYWATNNTPTSERNLFYLGYTVFYSGPPPVIVNNGWFFDEPAASGHLLTSGII
jgi:hypothetical protein